MRGRVLRNSNQSCFIKIYENGEVLSKLINPFEANSCSTADYWIAPSLSSLSSLSLSVPQNLVAEECLKE
jgi:hypothetical protein